MRRADPGDTLTWYATGYDGQATLAAFRKISKDGHPVSDKGNYRNLQALGDRQIYRCVPSYCICGLLLGSVPRCKLGLGKE